MAKSLSKLKQDLAVLKNRLREAETREALKIGKLAVSEGLADLKLSDAEWREAFQEIAARFCESEKEPARKTQS